MTLKIEFDGRSVSLPDNRKGIAKVKLDGHPTISSIMVYPVEGEDKKPVQVVVFGVHNSVGWSEKLETGQEFSFHDLSVRFDPDLEVVRIPKQHEAGIVTTMNFFDVAKPIEGRNG